MPGQTLSYSFAVYNPNVAFPLNDLRVCYKLGEHHPVSILARIIHELQNG